MSPFSIADLVWTQLDILLHSWRPRERDTDWMLNFSAMHYIDSPILIFERLPKGDPQLNSENLSKRVELVLMSDPSYLHDPNFLLHENFSSFGLAATSHMEN